MQTLRNLGDNYVLAVAFAGNKHLLSASDVPGIHNWDLSTGKVVGSFNTADLIVREITTDRDGHAAVACCGPKDQQVGAGALQPLDGGHTKQLMGQGIIGATISSDGAPVRDGFWPTSCTRGFRRSAYSGARCGFEASRRDAFELAISPDGKLAATTCVNGGLWLWNR